MANTSHQHMVVQGSNFLGILPVTLSSGKIASVGTIIKIEALSEIGFTFANAESSSEYIEATMANGVKVEMPAVTKTLDAVTGAEKNASGSDSYDTAKVTTLEVSRASLAELQALLGGDPLFIIFGLGELSSGSQSGYGLLYCSISGELDVTLKGNEIASVSLSFKGMSGTADTGFDETDLNAAGAFGQGIDPMGGTAITKLIDTGNAITSGELTSLLAGKIVLKAVA